MTGRRTLIAASCLIVGFVALFIYAAIQLIAVERAMSGEVGEPMLWAASQAEHETMMLRLAVKDAQLNKMGNVDLQFELLYSRVNLIAEDPQRSYFQSIGGEPKVKASIALMQKLDAIPRDEFSKPQVDAEIAKLQRIFGELSNQTFLQERLLQQSRRTSQRTALWLILASVVGAFVTGLVIASMMVRNLSSARRAQALLQRHSDELEGVVQARTKELREALEIEKRAREVYRSFIHNVSHQFRTPVSIIHLVAQRQLRRRPDDDTSKRAFGKIFDAAERLELLMASFLNKASIERCQLKPVFQRMNLNDVASSAVRQMRKANPGRRIDCALAPEDLTTDGDEVLLEQAILALIENALKYSQAPSLVHLATDRDASDTISCTVTDEGIGIPEAERTSIFERLFRASNALQFRGNGVGLNLVRDVVELHRGTVTFYARPDTGTRFVFKLPFAEQA